MGKGVLALAVGAAAALVAATASELESQTVRGMVTDPESAEPLWGAVVVLERESDESVAAGAIADEGGRFLVRAPSPGSYRLSVQRIGYRTTFTPLFDLAAGQDLRRDLQAPVEAIALDEIRVVAQRRCAPLAEGREEAFLMWEEARKALTATLITEGMGGYQFDLALYERDLEPRGHRVVEESRREALAQGRTPFRSLPVERLTEEGYVLEEADGTLVYNAPDARALLSTTFSASYCFRLVRGRDDNVGLEFEPLRGRSLPDIRGTLWLEGSTAELQRLEYRYVNLPVRPRVRGAGGQVFFDRLPDGGWIVREWSIRMPLIGRERRGFPQREELVLRGWKEEAAEVRRVRTSDGSVVRDYGAANSTSEGGGRVGHLLAISSR